VRRKLISQNYKNELADIVEEKGFSNEAENLLLNMVYKIEDAYPNYATVKRQVPNFDEYINSLVANIDDYCDDIQIATPHSRLEKSLIQDKVKLKNNYNASKRKRTVISYPNAKNLLYEISKSAIMPATSRWGEAAEAIYTTLNIGRCIAIAEVLRDFNGWSWSIDEREIESSECNIIFTFLSFIIGPSIYEKIELNLIKSAISPELFEEVRRASIQFYASIDKTKNEEILRKINDDKTELERMKKKMPSVLEVDENIKKATTEMKQIDKVINNPTELKKQFFDYNKKVPQNRKIFSISDYADLLENKKEQILKKIKQYNEVVNPKNFMKKMQKLEYEIKFYEGKTDISKLSKIFLQELEDKISRARSRREILNLLYEIRYLNFLPKCKLKLEDLKEKIIPKAIKAEIIAPVANNNLLDYRILKGIFDSQVVSLDKLMIKLSSSENKIHVEIYDEEMLDSSYDVAVPEDSEIEIRTSKRVKIFV